MKDAPVNDRREFSIPTAADVVGQTNDGRPIIRFRGGPFKGRAYAMKAGGGLEKAWLRMPPFTGRTK